MDCRENRQIFEKIYTHPWRRDFFERYIVSKQGTMMKKRVSSNILYGTFVNMTNKIYRFIEKTKEGYVLWDEKKEKERIVQFCPKIANSLNYNHSYKIKSRKEFINDIALLEEKKAIIKEQDKYLDLYLQRKLLHLNKRVSHKGIKKGHWKRDFLSMTFDERTKILGEFFVGARAKPIKYIDDINSVDNDKSLINESLIDDINDTNIIDNDNLSIDNNESLINDTNIIDNDNLSVNNLSVDIDNEENKP